jgi:hypothetical protein
MSNYLENALLDHVLGSKSYTKPSSLYVALYTANPTDNDTATEVSGSGYARQKVTFGTASNGSISNSADITFPVATGSWGIVSHIGIRDASTGGNLLFSGALSSSQTIVANNQLIIKAGQLTITLD